ncbi:MAG: helix-turn-helix domain-containing protein [Burkholderiaceae bacterium]|nr:helix-turn-helix domain-containing protein [Burkholderiaceae bacterium]
MFVTPQETFLTLAEAAEALACDPATVRRLAAEGQIVGRKPGRAWVFTASSLAAHT